MPTVRARIRSRRAVHFIRVAAIPFLAFLVLAGWAIASPVGASPDDDFHQTSIWCAGGIQEGLCAPGKASDTRYVPDEVDSAPCYRYHPDVSASCGTYGQFAGDHMVETTRGNFTGGYPPFYYDTMHLFVSNNIDESIVTMRLVNAFIFVSLTTVLCWLLPTRRRWALIGALCVTLVPLGLFLISSLNPSSWAITSAALVMLSVVGYFESHGWRRIALGVLALLATFLGGGARADAAAFAALAALIAVALKLRLAHLRRVSTLLPLAVIVFAACLYFVGNQGASALGGEMGSARVPGKVSTLIVRILFDLPTLWAGAFGTGSGLGWLDTAMPSAVWVPGLLCFGGVVFTGLGSNSSRKGLMLGALAAVLIALPLYLLVQNHVIVGMEVQARYLLPLIIILASVALFRTEKGSIEFSGVQCGLIALGLAVAQAVALHTNLRRYVTGVDVFGLNLSRNVEWWWHIPLTPMMTWLLTSASFGVLMMLIALEYRRSMAAKLPSFRSMPVRRPLDARHTTEVIG